MLYNIPAMDNLALGDIKKIPDKERIRKAAQAAGIDDVLDRLPLMVTILCLKSFLKAARN